MTTSDAVLAFVKGARATAEAAQSCVVQGWPQGDHNVLKVVLDPDEILRVIEASRPKLIYLAEAIFDAEEEARLHLLYGCCGVADIVQRFACSSVKRD